MNLGTIKARARRIAGSPSPSRWNEQTLTDMANDAQVQLAMQLDFPQTTLIIPTMIPPAQAPTLAVVGAAGTQQTIYAYCQIASMGMGVNGGGDSAPSPNAQVTTAPAAPSNENYVSVAMDTVPGVSYRVLRQRIGVDAFPMLLTSFTANAATTTINDQGQYATQPYRISRGNEYQMPDLVKILRAYLQAPNGTVQPLVPLDIAWLNGDTNETWDQSSGQIQGYAEFTPQWLAQGPVPFPVQSPVGGRVQVATPWQDVSLGQTRPGYYLRGGYFGIMPPPDATGYQAFVEIIPKPRLLRQNSDLSDFPDTCLDALAYKMRAYMAMGDDSSVDVDFETRFANECTKVRTVLVDSIQANKPHALVPLTIRTQMRNWPT